MPLCSDFGWYGLSTINNRSQVFKIGTTQKISFTATSERFEFGSNEVRGCDYSDFEFRRDSSRYRAPYTSG